MDDKNYIFVGVSPPPFPRIKCGEIKLARETVRRGRESVCERDRETQTHMQSDKQTQRESEG